MDRFCVYCGKKLNEGEVCTCIEAQKQAWREKKNEAEIDGKEFNSPNPDPAYQEIGSGDTRNMPDGVKGQLELFESMDSHLYSIERDVHFIRVIVNIIVVILAILLFIYLRFIYELYSLAK